MGDWLGVVDEWDTHVGSRWLDGSANLGEV
jgi:hypothetical protein